MNCAAHYRSSRYKVSAEISSRRFETVDLVCSRFDPRNELATELHRIIERIESANEKGIDPAHEKEMAPQPIILEHRLRHLLRRANQARCIAQRPRCARNRYPQAL